MGRTRSSTRMFSKSSLITVGHQLVCVPHLSRFLRETVEVPNMEARVVLFGFVPQVGPIVRFDQGTGYNAGKRQGRLPAMHGTTPILVFGRNTTVETFVIKHRTNSGKISR